MNRKRFMKCRLLRRCGAVLLAAALSLSVLGTGSAFADTTDNGEEIVEMTVSGNYEASVYEAFVYEASVYEASVYEASVYEASVYEASIDEAGGYVYYVFTPEESGTYRFYTTGDSDTYAYIYDADWNLLDSCIPVFPSALSQYCIHVMMKNKAERKQNLVKALSAGALFGGVMHYDQ